MTQGTMSLMYNHQNQFRIKVVMATITRFKNSIFRTLIFEGINLRYKLLILTPGEGGLTS